MTPLPSRLRASAQEMRTLDAVSLRPSSLALIDRERATSIARELEEAAQALEAQREDRREVLRILYEAHRKTNPSPSLAAISAAIQHLQAVEDAPSAQVAQEGGKPWPFTGCSGPLTDCDMPDAAGVLEPTKEQR